jgi:hypothetical protein
MTELNMHGTSIAHSDYGDNNLTLLIRDPNCLYAYWEVSDNIRNAFIEDFGSELWEKSVPVIKITNLSNQGSFFVRINDFSNSWFINIDNPDDAYVAELGRKVSERFFISLASSNCITPSGNTATKSSSVFFANYKDIKNTMFESTLSEPCEEITKRAYSRFSSDTLYK